MDGGVKEDQGEPWPPRIDVHPHIPELGVQ